MTVVQLDSVPLVLDKYEPIRRLAAGGMGEVYLARQRGMAGFQRLVALKRLLPNLAGDPEFVKQFLDEARMVANVAHPNVVSIYEVGRSLGTYFIAMELIRGASASRLVEHLEEDDRGLPMQHTVSIARDVAAGLHAVHTALGPDGTPVNLVHRDISPHNIMVDLHGTARIVDFGIAKAANRLGNTETGMIKGKLSYMPIEQLRGEPVDGRADQFSLGVVLWQLLTGERLFATENLVDLVNQREIRPASSVNPDVPTALDAVVTRMLSHQASERYPSCRDVERELEGVLQSSVLPQPEVGLADFMGAELGNSIDLRFVDRPPTAELSQELREMLTSAVIDTPPEARPTTGQRPKTDKLPPADAPIDDSPVHALAEPGIPPRLDFSHRSPRRRNWVTLLLLLMSLTAMGALVWTEVVPGLRADMPSSTAETKRKAKRKLKPTRKRAPVNSTAAKSVGYLNIKTTPWAEVWVGDEFVGSTPIFRRAVPPGRHVVRMVNKFEGIEKRKTITVTAGELTTLTVKLE